jgi:chemotaxis protein MotB
MAVISKLGMNRSTSLNSSIVSAPGPSQGASAYRWRLAAGFCVIATFLVIAGFYVPTYREAARLRSERETLETERAASNAALEVVRNDLARLERESEPLRRDAAASKNGDANVARRIEKLERLLSAQFARLVQAKMLAISSADDRVSVAMAVPALFSTRDRLTKSGRALLCQVAKTIMSEFKGQIRVSGYYGKPRLAPPDSGWRFATPWHLSAARASSAADALEEDCGVPPDRFFVVSYGPRAAGPIGENVALEFIFKSED